MPLNNANPDGTQLTLPPADFHNVILLWDGVRYFATDGSLISMSNNDYNILLYKWGIIRPV
jgi:hypothetical protein